LIKKKPSWPICAQCLTTLSNSKLKFVRCKKAAERLKVKRELALSLGPRTLYLSSF
jgi:hypothetical protein